MLPARNRMRAAVDFERTIRRGVRARRPRVTGYLDTSLRQEPSADPQIGFVVSRAVGGAVVRNVVARRLRHAAREQIARLPAGSALVLRAHSSAADSPYAALQGDVDGVVDQLLRRAPRGRDRAAT